MKHNPLTYLFADKMRSAIIMAIRYVIAIYACYLWAKADKQSKLFFALFAISLSCLAIDSSIYRITYYFYALSSTQVPAFWSITSNVFHNLYLLFSFAAFGYILSKTKLLYPKNNVLIYAPILIIASSLFFIFFYSYQWANTSFSILGILDILEDCITLLLFLTVLFNLVLARNTALIVLLIKYIITMPTEFTLDLGFFSQRYGTGSFLETIWVLGLLLIGYGLYLFHKTQEYKTSPASWVAPPNSLKAHFTLRNFLVTNGIFVFILVISYIYDPTDAFEKILQSFFPFYAIISVAIIALSNSLANRICQPLRAMTDLMQAFSESNTADATHLIPATDTIEEFGKLHNFMTFSFSKLRNTFESKMETAKSLTASIAHEMKNPLQKITSNKDVIAIAAEKLQPGTLDAEQTNKYFHMLKSCVTNIEKTVKDAAATISLILNNVKHEKINKGQFENYYISSTIEDALDEYPFQSDERALVHWANDDDFTYHGDKTYIKIVLHNLIKNALHFIKDADHGEIFIKVIGNNKIIFKDTACGINAADLPRIFDAFYSKRKGGSGLGLAFCKRVMKECGGDITCHSSIDAGNEFTEFTLELPKA
jgi:signal transduction histidine kinase